MAKKSIANVSNRKEIVDVPKTTMQYRMIPDHYTNINSITGEWEIEIHLPGIKKEEINLRVLPDLFDLQAKRTEQNLYCLTEYFPYEISPDSIQAKYENGLLRIKGKIKDPLDKAFEIKIE